MEPSQNTQEVVQEQKKFEELRTITPLSKYLAMALFILMPFIGGWIGYTYAPEKVVEVEKVVVREKPVENRNDAVSPAEKLYVSEDRVLRFSYPTNLAVSPVSTTILWTPQEGTSTVTYPDGSIEIPGLFIVSRVPYAQISEENKIFDYDSCCTGSRYWFDASNNVWNAEKIVPTQYDENNKPVPQQSETVSLEQNGICSLVQEFGPNKFYRIASGDEAVPTEFYYFLMTNKGYAIRFMSAFDLQDDYAGDESSTKPDSKMIEQASRILSSVSLSEGAEIVTPSCR